jgi:hypothetical protein
MLSQSRLKELLHYDPATGVWTWLVDRPGKGAKVGDHPAHLEGSGYLQFSVDGRNYRSCRLAWLYMTGEWPPSQIDHEDRNRTNDRWTNLRLATHSQNKANSGAYANNSLGVKGVGTTARMKSKPYRARIQVDGSAVHLGYFATPEQANAAYAEAARRYFGDFGVAA